MGHRDDLIVGAKQCLYERGFARTTARDIVAASGTNLASIGYHFGSKEELLVVAMVAALDDWGEEVGERLAPLLGEPDPLVRLEAAWTAVIDSVTAHRSLWLASFEVFAQADRSPRLREQLAEAHRMARVGLAGLISQLDATDGDETARTVGSFHLAMIGGLATQWLIDADNAPSARELAEGMRRVQRSVRPD